MVHIVLSVVMLLVMVRGGLDVDLVVWGSHRGGGPGRVEDLVGWP